ncbi:Uncharacterized protein Fot_24265 [Forsythia ovata]|uniref:Uncharacterized protein n=1 Tax=Forsythia ovata TaxID=205694 RepID=A0ABD1U5R2_9LAMI
MPWEEGLAKKDEELGVLNAKVESQDLALAEMSAKVEAIQKDLANFRDSDEGKQIFEDGKQAGRMKLLELIKDELPNINFDFIYEEGETVSLVLPLETVNNETVAEPASFEAESKAVIEPTTGTLPSQVHGVLNGNLRLLFLDLAPCCRYNLWATAVRAIPSNFHQKAYIYFRPSCQPFSLPQGILSCRGYQIDEFCRT